VGTNGMGVCCGPKWKKNKQINSVYLAQTYANSVPYTRKLDKSTHYTRDYLKEKSEKEKTQKAIH
jgi:hypothetical protein